MAPEAVSDSGGGGQHFVDRHRGARGRVASAELRSSRRPASRAGARRSTGSSTGGAQSVDRAADILLAFTSRQPVLTLGEVAEKSSLPKPTAHRLIQSLVSRGLMQRSPDGRYELGFRIYELGVIAQTRFSLGSLAREAMETLASETGETVILSHADMDTLEAMALEAKMPTHALGVRPLHGRRPLIPPGPQAKSLLAALAPSDFHKILDIYAHRGPDERLLIETGQIQHEIQRTRQRGYAVDEQDYIVGVTGVSSWIVFGDPLTAAAIAVVAPSERFSGVRIERVGARVRQLAIELSFSGHRELPVGGY